MIFALIFMELMQFIMSAMEHTPIKCLLFSLYHTSIPGNSLSANSDGPYAIIKSQIEANGTAYWQPRDRSTSPLSHIARWWCLR